MHSLSSLAVYKKGAGTTIMLGPGGWVFLHTLNSHLSPGA